jgi:hypothetical protein
VTKRLTTPRGSESQPNPVPGLAASRPLQRPLWITSACCLVVRPRLETRRSRYFAGGRFVEEGALLGLSDPRGVHRMTSGWHAIPGVEQTCFPFTWVQARQACLVTWQLCAEPAAGELARVAASARMSIRGTMPEQEQRFNYVARVNRAMTKGEQRPLGASMAQASI